MSAPAETAPKGTESPKVVSPRSLTLNRIHPIYRKRGTTQIYYFKREFFKHTMTQNGLELVDIDDLEKTHTHIGDIESDNLDNIYKNMQISQFSPNGEADAFFASKEITHKSISNGDIVKIGDDYYYFFTRGPHKLERNKQ
jgi:hypothetical protein